MDIRIRLETPARQILDSDRCGLAVGVVVATSDRAPAIGERVLCPVQVAGAAYPPAGEVTAGASVYVPDEIAGEDALLVPHLARALWSWQTLGLELGEAAVSSGAGPASNLLALVATWRGALPVIRLTNDEAVDGGVELVSAADAFVATARLESLVAQAPGVAAIDLSDHASLLPIVLEALPRLSRVMFGGTQVAPFTTDVYSDIHRKGTVICPGPVDVEMLFAELPRWQAHLDRAFGLMRNAERRAQVRTALSAPVARGAALRA